MALPKREAGRSGDRRRGDLGRERVDACWRWPGVHRKSDGRPKAGKEYAYRLVYKLLIDADLADDRFLHHTCDHPWCVNPWHLQALTGQEHALIHAPRPRVKKAVCVNGHDLTDPANVVTTVRQSGPRAGKVERHCRPCMVEWKRRARG